MSEPKQHPQRSARRWKAVMRCCQVSLAVLVGVAVWSVGFATDAGPAPVLPDTDEQFSLDMKVAATTEHQVVYVVEQRARPAYRIFAFDPTTGEDTTVFTVPANAIIYGIALSNDGTNLAVTYSPDYELDGNGLALLDIESGELTMVLEVEPGVFHTDPTWTPDGDHVLTTRVDRTGDDEQLSVGRIEVEAGTAEVLAADAINPVVIGTDVYALAVDEEKARRSIGRVVGDGIEPIVGGDLDLDHLVATRSDELVVAAIDSDDGGGLTFGSVASAHGNHNQPSTWWTLRLTDGQAGAGEPVMSEVPSIIVHDAVAGDGAVVYATSEGLSISVLDSGDRIDLIESRAIRFVTT